MVSFLVCLFLVSSSLPHPRVLVKPMDLIELALCKCLGCIKGSEWVEDIPILWLLGSLPQPLVYLNSDTCQYSNLLGTKLMLANRKANVAENTVPRLT